MNTKVLQLLQLYDNMLTAQGCHRSQCENTAQSEDQRLFHARWMIDQVQQRAEKEKWSEVKVNRWLGFIQGILFCSNLAGIVALRDQSRDLYTEPMKEKPVTIKEPAVETKAQSIPPRTGGL